MLHTENHWCFSTPPTFGKGGDASNFVVGLSTGSFRYLQEPADPPGSPLSRISLGRETLICEISNSISYNARDARAGALTHPTLGCSRLAESAPRVQQEPCCLDGCIHQTLILEFVAEMDQIQAERVSRIAMHLTTGVVQVSKDVWTYFRLCIAGVGCRCPECLLSTGASTTPSANCGV